MIERIQEKLRWMETEKNVRVLFACESGSRAWGFASSDSDYDVRFIYMQPTDIYLSIFNSTDFIELPVDEELDINGWDLRKALRLFLTSNPPLYEWLQSPVIYRQNQDFLRDLITLMPIYFSMRAGCHHYVSMTQKMVDNHLQGQLVRIKKYFYALRTALAGLWIVRKHEVPPMQLEHLRELVTDASWQQAVDHLLELKKVSEEKTTVEPVPVLHRWLDNAIAETKEKSAALPAQKQSGHELDTIFRKWMYNYDV